MTNRATEVPTNAAGYLDTIRTLIAEMSAAIDAVSRNALPDLELSLWQQEMTCATLARLLRRRERIPDRDSALLLAKELGTLKRTSESYERVVDRARASTSLLLDLCSFHAAVPHYTRSSNGWEA